MKKPDFTTYIVNYTAPNGKHFPELAFKATLVRAVRKVVKRSGLANGEDLQILYDITARRSYRSAAPTLHALKVILGDRLSVYRVERHDHFVEQTIKLDSSIADAPE